MGYYRRRNFFINKDFQSRFILRFVITTTAWSAAMTVLFAVFAQKKIEDTIYSSHIGVKSVMELLGPAAWMSHGVALLLFIALLLIAVHSLRNKLSAPLFSIKKDIGRIAAGDLRSEVSIREGEEFQELAAGIDRMRTELAKKILGLKATQASLSSAVSRLAGAALKGDLSDQHARSVLNAAAKVKEELDRFRC